jgi:hypothetical protein
MNRRNFTFSLAYGLTLSQQLSFAQESTWPKARVSVIVPFPPGAATDITGRVISVNGSQITLDAPIDIGTQTLTLSLPDNTVRTTQIKTFISDTVIDINDEGFSVMPEPMSIWVAARGAVNSTTWRVVSVAESDKGILQVTALTHNPSKYKYVEENIAIETPPDNSIGLPKPVKDLTLVESLYFGEGNTINVRGTLSWSSKEPYFVVRWREYEGTWTSREVSVTSIDIPLAVGDWEFEVLALNVLGVRGEAVLLQQYIYGKTKPPSTVQNVKVDILPDNVIVSWDSVPDIDLDVYEVRLGEDLDLAKVIGDAKVNFLFLSPMIAGTYTVHVRAKDYEPLYSQESGTATFTIVMPSTPEVETKLSNGDVTFSWNLPVSSHRIISYELWETISDVSSKFLENKKLVKNRNDYSLSLVAQFSGLSYTMQVIWEGEKIFFVRALDVAGNVSYDGEATVTINKPIMPSISNQVIDNNVLLRWQGSQNTVSRFADTYTSGARLPIKYYNFKSGKFIDESAPQWDDGNIKDMGRITGEFTMVYETTGGRYRYFLQAVDTGGNVSDIGYSDALVDQPPDFNLWVDQDSYLTEPLAWTSNALYIANKNSSGYIYESGFLAPLGGISNTWGAHFLQHQWRTIRDKVNDGYPVYNELYAGKLTWKSHYEQFDYKTPKDQIDAGFPIYLQPTDMVPAIYEHEFDFGVALPSLRFDVALDKENRYGETSVRIDIAVKANIEDNWLEEIDTDYMVLPESSRYIKIRITVTSDEDRLSYALFRKMNMSLAAKYKTDQGEIDVPEEGISVNFGVAFVDVISVNATARGEAPVYCAVDFLDEPYPKDFKIYAFDSTGKPTQAHVTWSARGF